MSDIPKYARHGMAFLDALIAGKYRKAAKPSAIDECDCGHLRAAHGPDIRDHDTTEGACRVPTCPCIDFYHNREANG